MIKKNQLDETMLPAILRLVITKKNKPLRNALAGFAAEIALNDGVVRVQCRGGRHRSQVIAKLVGKTLVGGGASSTEAMMAGTGGQEDRRTGGRTNGIVVNEVNESRFETQRQRDAT